jgi:hypothetical protein
MFVAWDINCHLNNKALWVMIVRDEIKLWDFDLQDQDRNFIMEWTYEEMYEFLTAEEIEQRIHQD